jgi:small-conductance mechanosensitive channel
LIEHLQTISGLDRAAIERLANLAGWGFLLLRRPFEIGDRIEIDGARGDVVDIRMFQHSLMEIGNWIEGDERTGRLLHIPNARVLSTVIANYTKGWFEHIWDELSVLVTFESNWEEARRLLHGIVDACAPASPEGIPLQTAATAILVMDASTQSSVSIAIKDHGIQLRVRYVCDPRKRGAVRQKIWEAMLRAFAKRNDIEFAYPTRRQYDRNVEGKAARPPSRLA